MNATMQKKNLVMQTRCVQQIRWLPPKTGWVKLNTNGAFQSSNGKAGCVGSQRIWERVVLMLQSFRVFSRDCILFRAMAIVGLKLSWILRWLLIVLICAAKGVLKIGDC